MTCPMKGRPEQSFLDTFSERFMNHVRQVCTFAKSIPGFKCLHHDDQVCLLKSCIFEVLLVRLSGLFDNQSLVCLNGDVIKRETISAMPAGNAKFLMDSVFELSQRINRFKLADAEIGLFSSVVIIAADRPGLRNPEIVSQMQAKLKLVLQNILASQHPENTPGIFSELVTILHDLLYGAGGEWEAGDQDRDSTGSRSPQSSDSQVTNPYSYEDMRRSPIGSVSSSESLGSGETFSKLSVNDLKMHGVGSVLLSALTSPAMTAACPATRKREREVSRSNADNNRAVETPAGGQESKCPFKARKLDSPSDSGIDSPKAQGSHSTNTSLCSSPRSSMEDKVKDVETEESSASAAPAVAGPVVTLEEQHPLLKRALQQPPQPFNMGGVSGFQDEVYHKKFRHSGRKDSNEPTSTQESPGGARSPSPVTGGSILASQLAAPPSYSSSSVLASTLSRPVAIPGAKESEQRNEWLANLILERRPQPPPPSQAQSLLMCAPAPAHSAQRHIPVPVAPSQQTAPHPGRSHQPTQHNNSHRKMALSAASNSNTSSSSSSTSDSQPLNLSTRTPPPADIPTEA